MSTIVKSYFASLCFLYAIEIQRNERKIFNNYVHTIVTPSSHENKSASRRQASLDDHFVLNFRTDHGTHDHMLSLRMASFSTKLSALLFASWTCYSPSTANRSDDFQSICEDRSTGTIWWESLPFSFERCLPHSVVMLSIVASDATKWFWDDHSSSMR